MFGVKKSVFTALQKYFGSKITFLSADDVSKMVQQVDRSTASRQYFGIIGDDDLSPYGIAEISNPEYNLPVGTLQAFLDTFLVNGGADQIDYVHGQDVVCRLGGQKGNTGFYLPVMDKSDLFKTVILDGVLPRKTFSMGQALEKRFYMEARRIK